MKFCKDCQYCTASKPKTGTVVQVPEGADWTCTAGQFHVVTGKRVLPDVLPCVQMRAAQCGPGAVLFAAKAKR